MNPGIEAIHLLTKIGYRAWVEREAVRLRYEGFGHPDPIQVQPLIELVRANKPDVLAYLSKPAPRERIITCADCPHFEANQGPNPREGWGRCLKRNKGRFGCATACEKVLAPGPKEASNE
jgi:hypothetical protein